MAEDRKPEIVIEKEEDVAKLKGCTIENVALYREMFVLTVSHPLLSENVDVNVRVLAKIGYAPSPSMGGYIMILKPWVEVDSSRPGEEGEEDV